MPRSARPCISEPSLLRASTTRHTGPHATRKARDSSVCGWSLAAMPATAAATRPRRRTTVGTESSATTAGHAVTSAVPKMARPSFVHSASSSSGIALATALRTSLVDSGAEKATDDCVAKCSRSAACGSPRPAHRRTRYRTAVWYDARPLDRELTRPPTDAASVSDVAAATALTMDTRASSKKSMSSLSVSATAPGGAES
mmetsp:Transcript_15442/g.48242  ORF Transcript_15442/g.48242 Transcript_15442/m.48242 type:complete len:200 (+) Transcript_15442:1833-2432(+)